MGWGPALGEQVSVASRKDILVMAITSFIDLSSYKQFQWLVGKIY